MKPTKDLWVATFTYRDGARLKNGRCIVEAVDAKTAEESAVKTIAEWHQQFKITAVKPY